MVTLASIVEKETGRADERPRIAQVLINRLTLPNFKPRMLQTDPTIIYGCTVAPLALGKASPACQKFKNNNIQRIHLNDRENEYNTYTNEGLPPGPIANPGPRLAGGGDEARRLDLPVLHRRRRRAPTSRPPRPSTRRRCPSTCSAAARCASSRVTRGRSSTSQAQASQRCAYNDAHVGTHAGAGSGVRGRHGGVPQESPAGARRWRSSPPPRPASCWWRSSCSPACSGPRPAPVRSPSGWGCRSARRTC